MDTRPPAPDTTQRALTLRWLRTQRPPMVELCLQLGLVLVAVLIYFGVRGLTEGDEATAVAHGFDLLRVEGAVGLDVEGRLQRVILDRDVLVTVANWVYIWLHWPVIAAALLWLHRRRRNAYLVLRNAMFVSGAIGLLVFVSYPVAPPRLMPIGLADTVTQHSNSYRVLQPPGLVNKYAALPSLHAGWNLLVGMMLFRVSANRAVRVFALVSPVLMAFAVVATANHYVLDPIVGWLVSLVGLAAAVRSFPVLYGRPWSADAPAQRARRAARRAMRSRSSRMSPSTPSATNVSARSSSVTPQQKTTP